MFHYMEFADGARFDLAEMAHAGAEYIAGHRRDVITARVNGSYEQMKAAFNGQAWALGSDAEGAYDKSEYTVVASLCDNMDGTVTVRVGRKNTLEETLADEKEALRAENEALNIQIDDLVIELLEGGAVDVSETEATV